MASSRTEPEEVLGGVGIFCYKSNGLQATSDGLQLSSFFVVMPGASSFLLPSSGALCY